MSDVQGNTAIVAIVIAVIAFFVTTAQLLQALFGTAEGYRRCQSSIMGKWATKTRRRWRWSEFRFETKFTTPYIHLRPVGVPTYITGIPNFAFITGTAGSRHETCSEDDIVEKAADTEGTDDVVSWLALLDRLHHLQDSFTDEKINVVVEKSMDTPYAALSTRVLPGFCGATCPAITFRTRSWDFMPPEIVRPVASSTIGDVIAITQRLGMGWRDIRPDDGVMRAEGNGQSIVSTIVRGFGILMQYSSDSAVFHKNVDSWKNVSIPSEEADKLGFGIIPGFKELGLSDFVFGDSSEVDAVKTAMEQLGINHYVYNGYISAIKRTNRLFGFSDLVAMAAPFMPLHQSSIVQIYKPHRDVHDSPLAWWEGFVVFHSRLLAELEKLKASGEESKQLQWVHDKFEYMRSTYPWNQCPSWEAETKNKEVLNGRSRTFLGDLHDIWQQTTLYFQGLQGKSHGEKSTAVFRYGDLVGAHIAQAVHYPDLADERIKAGGKSTDHRYDLGAYRSKRVAEAMHIYVDQVPFVVRLMKEKAFEDDKLVRDAWWTLILRAMCWHRSVAFVERPRNGMVVPSSFHGSRIPVYIA